MKTAALLLLSIASAGWAIAQTSASAASGHPKSALDKATLEAYLRHMELFRKPASYKIDDPRPSRYLPGFSEVEVHLTFDDASRDELYYVSSDGQTILQGDVYNINKSPFQANLDKLTTTNDPSFGPTDAPVTLIEFGDLECPDCRMEAPVLRHNVPETFDGKVRVFFKNYPLESIHPWARAAAIADRCVYREGQAAFWKFYDWMYDNQDEITPENLNAKVLAWAGQNSLNTVDLGRCLDTKATEPEVNQSIAEGHALDIHGTPTLFINGRKIGGLAWPDLELVINHELEYLNPKPK